MAFRLEYEYLKLKFNFSARTSRGNMEDRGIWLIKFFDDQKNTLKGTGEVAPLAGLSVETDQVVLQELNQLVKAVRNLSAVQNGADDVLQKLNSNEYSSSVCFGLEMAVRDYFNGGIGVYYDSDFLRGKKIPINGLVWMADQVAMLEQARKKIGEGFKCIKLKVGGLNFDEECSLLERLRDEFGDQIDIRLDANGAFHKPDVWHKLERLSVFKPESIEQPIKAGQLDLMAEVCRESPIPVALDEELIGVSSADRGRLLDRLSPTFIVLKPGLHGGFYGTRDWIALAEERQMGWWITSALESSVGLSAIAQFTALYRNDMVHGLGTGGIYENNLPSALNAESGFLRLG
ncbi:MAG: o-succinylbenzoate synthase [Bacteroidetes bacterium]|nr:o-succinylbenzoate synthase [Bacteroidota bacterium]